MKPLSPRERQTLDAFIKASGGGRTNKHIARYLGITQETVKTYFRGIYAKTGCRSRADIAFWWFNKEKAANELG